MYSFLFILFLLFCSFYTVHISFTFYILSMLLHIVNRKFLHYHQFIFCFILYISRTFSLSLIIGSRKCLCKIPFLFRFSNSITLNCEIFWPYVDLKKFIILTINVNFIAITGRVKTDRSTISTEATKYLFLMSHDHKHLALIHANCI